MRDPDEHYFDRLSEKLEDALSVARSARATGRDPTTEVEIPVATDMADRVENILEIPGVADRVRELEAQMGREEAALELARDFANGHVGSYDSREEKIEAAVRTAVALLTEGVVAAPIEGIDRVEIHQNDDGTEFTRVFYAGPIRSAGGTAQALSVLVADYARSLLGIDRYKPRTDEIERYAEEISVYDSETGLQYTPSESESKYIARHCPIMLDGEPTGSESVSGYRDLDRVNTNRARGGMCLVLAEGIALKAPKIQRYTEQLDEVDWPWLSDLIDNTVDTDPDTAENAPPQPLPESATDASSATGPPRAEPAKKYLRDLIAGRPVFSHPSEPGGFRLRYGRARNHGFATAGIHPATMHIVGDFLAPGTQLKTERPGKAAGVVPVDSIEGPTVKLTTGEVKRIDDPAEAKRLQNGVETILDLGEYLVNYGEFVENNHSLAPASYVYEWWIQDLEATDCPIQQLVDDPTVDLVDPGAEDALAWAFEYDAPLHPKYTYCWHDIPVESVESLVEHTEATGQYSSDTDTLTIARESAICQTLETLLVPHTQHDTTIEIPDARPLVRSLGLTPDLDRTWTELSDTARTWDDGQNAIRAINEIAPFAVRERAPTRIGARMGRPEKSEKRELSPAVHTLFPIGEAGGDQRDFEAATAFATGMQDTPGEVTVDIGHRRCPDCGTTTHHMWCRSCRSHTEPAYHCSRCDITIETTDPSRTECPRCGQHPTSVNSRIIDLHDEYRSALDAIGERENAFDILKGVKGLMSPQKTPEPIEKGILRAKHGVSTFKDGTVRYDMTDLPVTTIRPAEIDVTPDQLRELGYHADIDGDPLEYDDQLVPLRVQDIILSDGAAEHLMSVANFVDDLLVKFYGLDPFYDLDDRDDLLGELVYGLAPHTSAAVLGRIVGFTSAAVGYAHPYFHAAKRRNCFHPATKLWYQNEYGQWRYETIESLVEERLVDPREDDFGTLVQELEGDLCVPSIDQNGDILTKPVETLSKHPASDHLVRIETRSGREITVTPDHEIHVFENGDIKSKRAHEISEKDYLVKPQHITPFLASPTTPTIDLLSEFIAIESIDNDRLMIKGLDKETLYNLFESKLADGWDAGPFYRLESTAQFFEMSHKTLSNYLYRGSFPVSLLLELFDSVDELLAFIPHDVQLGIKRDRTTINRFIEVNEDLATLLGYYTAEGFLREQPTSKGPIHQVTICGTEQEARDYYVRIFLQEFGANPYRENEAKVTVSGRLMNAVFDRVFDVGRYAHEKRVPQCIFDAPGDITAAYLRGYFSGDGSVQSNSLQINATTVSRELKEDLQALLTRLGIVVRVEHVDPMPLHQQFPDYYDADDPAMSAPGYVLSISSQDAVKYAADVGFHLSRKTQVLDSQVSRIQTRGRRAFDGGSGDYLVEPVKQVEYALSDIDHTYCLTVQGTHSLIANDMSVGQCDGDEDCVLLLMDGLLNFSRDYLPDQRGGTMDAPLVMSSRIDPTEIDDEAHNMDIVDRYPRSFYEATRRMADPGEISITLAEETIDTEREYAAFDHTHDTSDIALGPRLSAYKTLGAMTEKLEAQLELARILRAVDETDVAERIIEYHFLPDLLGNLRAFSRQETRCLDCGVKYRRMPLSATCRECGGTVNLTVHEGSVNKYMETAIEIAERYGASEYTRQRLLILDRTLESIFEDDTHKQTGIADFM